MREHLVGVQLMALRLKTEYMKYLPTIDYDFEDEEWQFKPGDIVLCRERRNEGLVINISYDYAENEI